MQRTIVLLASLISLTSALAQANEKPKDSRSWDERLWYGGGIGLGFGTITNIQANPMVGYKVDQEGKFSVGIGGSYTYVRNSLYQPPVSYDAYGYRTFSRYRFIENLFAHAEFLHLNYQAYDPLSDNLGRIWVPHLLVGGGYVQQASGRASIYLQVLWEVLQDPNSIYYNQGPVLSGGIGIGF